VRITQRLFCRAITLCLAGISLACGSANETSGTDSETPRTFSLESVEVGVGFDELVVVEGSADATETTEVVLVPAGSPGLFRGAVRAADSAGNTTELDLEVTASSPSL
jgi:hypothetical protein